nr:SGNH/GDSL hydrolase family protein [Legionella lansingensis]
MNHRKLGGVIPMDGISGLKGKSPKGSFTNGYVWDKDFGNDVAEEAIIKELKRQGKDSTDISDAIIDHDESVEKPLHDDFNLGDYRQTKFKNQDFIRYYTEGGLTSYDYSGRLTANLKLLATEKILATLDEKRNLLLQDDKARGIPPEHKKQTLITEWSGANDLMTVNEKPTKEAAEKAVAARLKNLEELIKNGYENFVLFNLPDLSLTPRFQAQSKEEQQNAREVSDYFNELLAEKVARLKEAYPDCSIDIFDVNTFFHDAYEHPEKYKLDPKKLRTPYTKSDDFELDKTNDTSPAPGYMFWDDVHPTAYVHELIAEKYYEEYSKKYNFSAPHETLLEQFKENYGQRWEDDLRGWFSFWRESNIGYKNPKLTLEMILDHALNEKGCRTRDVLVEMGWINQEGKLISKNPFLVEAMQELEQKKLEHEEHNDTEMSSLNPMSWFQWH